MSIIFNTLVLSVFMRRYAGDMPSFSGESIALRWCFFFIMSSITTFEEFSPLYFNELGFKAADVGFTSILAVVAPSLFVPLIGFLADKYRARKLAFFLVVLVQIPLTLVPLLPIISHHGCELKGVSNRSHSMTRSNSSASHRTTYYPETDFSLPKQIRINYTNPSFQLKQFSKMVKDFSNKDEETTDHAETKTDSSYFFDFLILMVIVRALINVLAYSSFAMLVVATMTTANKETASLGSYRCWGDIGSSVFLLAVGITASKIAQAACGALKHGYFITFIFTAMPLSIALIGIPWVTYAYEDRTVNYWEELKGSLFTIHYIVMLIIAGYAGFASSFQARWEYWYIAELSGSSVVMGIGGFTRRPLVAFWFYVSGRIISRIGELRTITLSLFLYCATFLTVAFIEIPWLVIAIDILQSAALAFSYSSLSVHFDKAGSKASSGAIQGK